MSVVNSGSYALTTTFQPLNATDLIDAISSPTTLIVAATMSVISVAGTPMATGAQVMTDAAASKGVVSSDQSISTISSAAAAQTSNATLEAIIGAQTNEQTDIDLTMPRNLFICMGGLLVLCMVIVTPQFLARFYSSLPSQCLFTRRRSYDKEGIVSRLGEPNLDRKVGGGDLRYGWFFRTSTSTTSQPSTLPSPSPRGTVHNNIELKASSATLYPPPYVEPFISKLPFQKFLTFAPFAKLPTLIRSTVTMVPLYFVATYIFLAGFGLFWGVDLNPPAVTSGFGYEFPRFAFIGTSQIPMTIALGVRGNLLGLCVGKGYERLKVLHKIVGMIAFIGSTLHVAAFIKRWIDSKDFWSSSLRLWIIEGYIAWFAMIVLMLTSISVFRKRFYTIFKVCHNVGMFALVIGLALHVDAAVPYCIAAAMAYGISVVAAFTKTRLAHAEISALPGSDMVTITIPQLTSGWRPGQHVRIRIPALGGKAALEAHPFTIASAPANEGETPRGLVIICKKAGDWTGKVYDFAMEAANQSGTKDRIRHEREFDLEGKQSATSLLFASDNYQKRSATVIIEGPWGGLGNTLPAAFSSVVLITGGSGLSLGIAVAEDLIERSKTGCVRPRLIELVWLAKNETEAKAAVERMLVPLVKRARAIEEAAIVGEREGRNVASPLGVRVTIYLTRCPSSSPITLVPPSIDFDILAKAYLKSAALSSKTSNYQNIYQPTHNKYESHSRIIDSIPSAAQAEKYAYLQRNPSFASSASTSSISSSDSKSTDKSPSKYYYPLPLALSSMQASPLRPHMPTLIETVVDSTIARNGRLGSAKKIGEGIRPMGVCVAVCGPEGLVHGVRNAVAGIDEGKKRAVGGVVLEEEFFGF